MFGKKLSSKADSLKSVKLFENLNDKQLEAIAQLADEVPMTAGTVLAKEGSLGEEFIFILNGTTRVEKDGVEIRKLSSGDYFGEIALLDGGARTASVVAESDVELLVIHVQGFNKLLDNVPELARNMLQALCSYIRSAESAAGSPRHSAQS